MTFPRVQTSRGELRIHEGLDDLSTDLVDYISEVSDASVKDRGVFTIALSGGSLIGLLGKIYEAPYNKTIDWAKWHIYWVDERVVPRNHADSNYKLVKDGLLTKVERLLIDNVQGFLTHLHNLSHHHLIAPVIPSHVHSINDSLSAEEAAREYEFGIRQLVKTRLIDVCDIGDCPKFDLVLLGMGPDGHVASLFPNHSALGVTDEWITFITDSPDPPPERITFTLPVINSASNVAVVVTGGAKAEAVHMAIDDVDVDVDVDVGPNLSLSFPARMVQPSRGKLVWFLDKLAASKLEGVQFSE